MDRSPPSPAGRFRRFVSARSLGTLVRITVTAAVLFQLLLRGIALPEPVAAGGTDDQKGLHVHLTGHPHHHHDDREWHHHGRRHKHADHQHDEHAADTHGPTQAGQCCDQLAADEAGESHPPRDNCPTDHDADVVYLDASLVIAPAAERAWLPVDDAAINRAQLPAATCSDSGIVRPQTSAPGGPPPDFRGRFPHRLQV